MSISNKLELRQATIGRQGLPLLADVDFSVQRGKSFLIYGENGIGKTTLIETIAGLVPLLGGDLRLFGQSVSRAPTYRRAGRGLRLVRDRNMLFAGLTIEQHFRLAGVAPDFVESLPSTLRTITERVWSRKPTTLSGGEQRITAILIALAASPSLLIVDEFVEGLQFSIVRELLELIEAARTERQMSAILVGQTPMLPLDAEVEPLDLSVFSRLDPTQ